MLKRITIENYRSCVRTSLDLHPQLSVLIGPNGSGKTNILQSIMLLNRWAQRGVRFSPPVMARGTSRIRAILQAGRVTAALNASFDGFKSEPSNYRRDVAQKWVLTEQNGQAMALSVPLSLPAIAGSEWSDLYRPKSFHLVTTYHRHQHFHRTKVPDWVARAMVQVAVFCDGIKYYSASQFTNPSSCPVSFEVEEGVRQSAVRYRDHRAVLYGMYSLKESGRSSYARFIDIVGPDGLRLINGLSFRKVRTSSNEYSVRVVGKVEVRRRNKLLIVPQFKIGRLTLSPNQLSEGTFKTLALLFHVITEDSTALMIEEPEVCVHHGLLSSILELIKTYSERKQMIISTHSDYVLDHVQPENVFSVSINKSTGTVARHMPKTMNRKEFSALKEYLATEGNLGEYWREGGLGSV